MFRQRFLDLILEMTKDQEGMITDLELERSSDLPKVNTSLYRDSFFIPWFSYSLLPLTIFVAKLLNL